MPCFLLKGVRSALRKCLHCCLRRGNLVEEDVQGGGLVVPVVCVVVCLPVLELDVVVRGYLEVLCILQGSDGLQQAAVSSAAWTGIACPMAVKPHAARCEERAQSMVNAGSADPGLSMRSGGNGSLKCPLLARLT